MFHFDCLVCAVEATDIARNVPATSVKDGRWAGSGAQHCSISLFQPRSQFGGTGGLSVLFTIPPASI